MTIWTRRIAPAITTLALAAVAALPAIAQPAPPAAPATHAAPHAPHGEHFQAKLQAKQQQRLERLHAVLQLQSKQESAWKEYVQALQAAKPTHAGKTRPAPQTQAQTTPELLKQAQQRRQAWAQMADQRDQATLRFYQQLSSSQQQAFDAWHSPARHAAPKKGHGPHHPRSVG